MVNQKINIGIDIHQYVGGCVHVAEVIKFQFYKTEVSI